MSEIYIVGVGRSGTSLLQSMLHAHSELTSAPESHFFRSYLSKEGKTAMFEKKGSKEFTKILRNDRHFQRLELNPGSFKALEGATFNMADVYTEINEQLKNRNRKSRLVDKDPRNLENISSIHSHFPQAQIIHIIRDPRDVVYSKLKANWSSKRPYWLHAMIGEAQMKHGLKSADRLKSVSYYRLRYEDLLEDPEETLKGLCDFLGIAFEEGMLRFNDAAKDLVTKEEMQWKKETLKPLMKGNRFKWKEFYTPFQLAVIEAIAKPTMLKFGYEKMSQPRSLKLWHKMGLPMATMGVRAFSMLYTRIK
ncbi:sulfotransferase family protein [Muriicola marianensis]|uniref:Sulfotransferase n=1 Tax=Muriicola marianensis TaxID=1324801 RepID=A0ABQ1QWH1_9FLAO|nr:sulfotransferase [Muriicola marianensis]GGD49785.1 hypothetical protein GCM10011361_15600 [Muriicola marianensis]